MRPTPSEPIGATRGRRAVSRLCGALLALYVSGARGDDYRSGVTAFRRHDYPRAARLVTEAALHGDPRAQTLLGLMFAEGRGVPQNFVVAAGWYACAARQDFPEAAFRLGLLYDKGHGVPQGSVVAYALLDRAVAGAGPERARWATIRDAVASKLNLFERFRAQELALSRPSGEACESLTAAR
jgi:uncharacterized protein